MAPPPHDDTLAIGRRLLADAKWARAREEFTAVGDAGGGEAWDGVAVATWWLDDGAGCLEARERAYRLFLDAGDALGAVRAATALGYDAALFGQGPSVARGWLGRARELLEARGDVDTPTAEHGWLAVREAELALQVTHRIDVAEESSQRALDVADALHDTELHCAALALQGLADVLGGRVEPGMERLDTAVVGALAGDVTDPMWVGKICCWLVVACRGANDLPRALEWCERVDELCRERDLAPLSTACRVQYASVQYASGNWIEAEQELVAALDRMRESRRATRSDAVVQLGHLRRRQGRLDEADRLYAQAGYAPSAVVGRALVRLERGEEDSAWALASGVLDDVPHQDLIARAAVLLPAVRCATAAGETAQAQVLAEELAGLADRLSSEGVLGAASAAAALVAEPSEAPGHWRAAARAFHRGGLPVDEADARLALAGMLADHEAGAAVEEAEAAVGVLERLDAPERLAAARRLCSELVRASTRRTSAVLTDRELEVLALVSEGRTTNGIARALVVSDHTVHRHVANILAKLGESTRAAAVAHAVREGIL